MKNKIIAKFSVFQIIILIVVMLATYLIFFNKNQSEIKRIQGEQQKAISAYEVPNTAKEVVADMKLGWNLGNTLDSPDGQNQDIETSYYETLWENPVTTKEMITEVKNAGFNAIRIPVTWYDHVYYEDDAGTVTKDIDINNLTVEQIGNIKIEEKWMQRVKEVVDYAKENTLYIILNVHHDVGTGAWPWIFASTDNTQRAKYEAVLEMLWKQIAEEFKEYDNQLLFEGFNEIMIEGATSWVGSYETSKVTSAHFEAVNRLNQKFVDTVRNTGGNNSSRFLIVNTYGAETVAEALDNFELPTDTIANHLIISGHLYDWGGQCQSGDNNTVYNALKRLQEKADSIGAGAIIGEFACRIGYIGEGQAALADNYYVRTAKSMGITCFYWDEGKGKNATMNLLDRDTLNWIYPRVVEGLVKGAEGQELSSDVVDSNVEPTQLTLNTSALTLDYNSKERANLIANIQPANAGKSTQVTWSSNNTNIVTVSSTGVLAPKGIPELINIQGPFAGGEEGTATITATITKEDGTQIQEKCQVTVTNKVKGKLSEVNLADFSNWRKGFYDWQKGYYFANGTDRICVDGYLEVEPNQQYVAQITGEYLVFTAREINENHELVKSTLLRNGDTLTTDSNTKYIALSMHKISDTSEEAQPMTLDDFEDAFNKNMQVALLADGQTPEEVHVTGVTLDKDLIELKEGEQATLVATVTPNNATNKNVTWRSENDEIATVNNGVVTAQKEGTTTITVTTVDGNYEDSADVTVTKEPIEENEVAKIEIKNAPSKTTYIKGENLELSDGTITVTYEDGTSAEIPMTSSEVQVTGYDSNTVGEQTLTVTYQGQTTSFTVTVRNEVTGIEIKTAPSKTTYVKGENLDLTDGTITVTYEDGTSAEVPMTSSEVQVTGYDSNTVGEQTLTVTYQGQTTSFTVTVRNEVTGIEIKTAPSKTTYVKGENLDLTDGTITVTYEDGTSAEVPMTSSEVQVTGYDSNTVGEQTLTVTYQGQTTSFTVTVKNEVTKIEIKNAPSKTTYIKGENLELSDGTITVTYEDGTSAEIPMTSSEVQVTGYDSNTVGEQTLTITYQGQSTSFKVMVQEEIIDDNNNNNNDDNNNGNNNNNNNGDNNNGNNNSNNSNNNNYDNNNGTNINDLVDKKLPNAGIRNTLTVLGIIVIINMIIAYIKYRRYKKIK